MHRVEHLLVLLRAGHGQHLGMRAGDILGLGPETAGDDDPAVLGRAPRRSPRGFRPWRCRESRRCSRSPRRRRHNRARCHSPRRAAGQDAFAVDQRLGAAERDHADGRLAGPSAGGRGATTSAGTPRPHAPRNRVCPACTGRPQNQKSSVAGSPTGHLQVRSVSSISVSFLAFFSISLDTLARASGLISLAEGCGGRGWPAG
jgi:hypothetical protein